MNKIRASKASSARSAFLKKPGLMFLDRAMSATPQARYLSRCGLGKQLAGRLIVPHGGVQRVHKNPIKKPLKARGISTNDQGSACDGLKVSGPDSTNF
jgi:hypothetical protein